MESRGRGTQSYFICRRRKGGNCTGTSKICSLLQLTGKRLLPQPFSDTDCHPHSRTELAASNSFWHSGRQGKSPRLFPVSVFNLQHNINSSQMPRTQQAESRERTPVFDCACSVPLKSQKSRGEGVANEGAKRCSRGRRGSAGSVHKDDCESGERVPTVPNQGQFLPKQLFENRLRVLKRLGVEGHRGHNFCQSLDTQQFPM